MDCAAGVGRGPGRTSKGRADVRPVNDEAGDSVAGMGRLSLSGIGEGRRIAMATGGRGHRSSPRDIAFSPFGCGGGAVEILRRKRADSHPAWRRAAVINRIGSWTDPPLVA